MPPSSWKPCSYCGQQFGASSLAIHMSRCRFRPDVASEMALREEEGYARPPPLPDWEHCPNCGEQYGKVAMPSHVKKCKRMRPHGANGYCATTPADHTASAQYAEQLVKKGESDAERLRALFDRFDKDKDNYLNMEESAAWYAPSQAATTRVGARVAPYWTASSPSDQMWTPHAFISATRAFPIPSPLSSLPSPLSSLPSPLSPLPFPLVPLPSP